MFNSPGDLSRRLTLFGCVNVQLRGAATAETSKTKEEPKKDKWYSGKNAWKVNISFDQTWMLSALVI